MVINTYYDEHFVMDINVEWLWYTCENCYVNYIWILKNS